MSIGVELGSAVGTNISSLSSLSFISGDIEGIVYVLSVGFAFGKMVDDTDFVFSNILKIFPLCVYMMGVGSV